MADILTQRTFTLEALFADESPTDNFDPTQQKA